jgi:hypothetical protein
MRVLLLAISVTAAFAADAPKQDARPQTLSSLVNSSPTVTIRRCPIDQDIVAVYSEQEPDWWGRLDVYHRNGETIDWQFAIPKAYEQSRGHYVVGFRWISLRQTARPVLEVIESTHKGNGSLRLFEADGRELRLLLDTEVRGQFWSAPTAFKVPENGTAYFEGSHLAIEYRSPSDQAVDSILLTGTIRIEESDGKVLPSRKFRQACVWDSTMRVFIAEPPTSP